MPKPVSPRSDRPSGVKKLPSPQISFPPAWTWFVDELVPTFVKQNYSPRESWKDKPFTRDDVHFFSKGVEELSELFTEERSRRIPSYFQHPKFRSAYLLYFLPLQMAKFVTLYQLHSQAIDAAIDHARKKGVLRIADLGAGPGTASLALLLSLLQRPGEIPPIELVWFDTHRSVMEDGEKLALAIADQFPKLRGKLSVKLFVSPWWEAPPALREGCSLVLLGHVLNEAKDLPSRFKTDTRQVEEDDETPPMLESVWPDLLKYAEGGGILIVEPASRPTAQYLSKLRNRLFETQTIPQTETSLWGPCPHAETCPLSFGKDWCHFSVPVRVPGRWFAEFSKALSSERQWLKFSYLWTSSAEFRSRPWNPNHKLVISDPLSKAGDVLLCEPERPGRISIASIGDVWRGDVLEIKKSR